MTEKKTKTTYYRHADGDEWFTLSNRVKKTCVLKTPWGDATAEVGTFIMTLKGNREHKIICTQDDLENYWTTDSVPDPPEPGEAIMDDPAPAREQILPGMKHYGA